MNERKDGGRAFPGPQNGICKGMSLREWFAGMALSGIIASETENWQALDEANVRRAYRVADLMLEQPRQTK